MKTINLKSKLLIFLLTGIALVVLPLSIQAEEKKETPVSLSGVTVIDTDTVKKWLDAGEDIFILDARKAPDYEAGHLPESESCTVPSDLTVEDAAIKKSVAALGKYEILSELEKDIKIVTYCNSYT